jgi:hypothetical protein
MCINSTLKRKLKLENTKRPLHRAEFSLVKVVAIRVNLKALMADPSLVGFSSPYKNQLYFCARRKPLELGTFKNCIQIQI